jgi:uncharacterized protein (DUF4415 family)
VHTKLDQYEWDADKAAANKRKHGIAFADAALSLEDPLSLSICPGERHRTAALQEHWMRKSYDFSKAKRGAVVMSASGKTRITIRLDDEVIEWFRARVEDAGHGNYQSLINAALLEHIQHQREPLEATLRRVIRQELRKVG